MAIEINGTTGISGVDGSAATPALQGQDTNTGISFGTDEVNVVTNGETQAKVDSSGRLLVGLTTGANRNLLQVQGDVDNGANGVGGISLRRGVGLGSIGDGSQLGQLDFCMSDGGVAARIICDAENTAGTGDYPGRLQFETTANGASSPTERFRIGSAGQLGIGGATYGTSGQVLTSQGNSAAPQWASPSAVIVKGSAVAFNNSTDVEFTGIGSTVCRIIFAVDKISANGNDRFTLELGHSGGYTTSGYISWAKTIGGSALATGSQLTSAFDLTANGSASESFSGVIELLNGSGNSWVLNSNLQGSADNRKIAGGRVVVGGTLTKIKFDVGGSTFDDGHVRMYTFTEA